MEIKQKYPKWMNLVERQAEYINGIMEAQSPIDTKMGIEPKTTRIRSIELLEPHENTTMFIVRGESFDCGITVPGGKIEESGEWVTFSGWAGNAWKIKKSINND